MGEPDAARERQVVVVDRALGGDHPPAIAIDGDHRRADDRHPLGGEHAVAARDLVKGDQPEQVAELRRGEQEERLALEERDLHARDEPLDGAGEADARERSAHDDEPRSP